EGQTEFNELRPLSGPAPVPNPPRAGDALIAFLLPLGVALAGSRVVLWLFRDLESVLSGGERIASGLGVGAFLLTQLGFALRLMGARLEGALAAGILIWAAVEL